MADTTSESNTVNKSLGSVFQGASFFTAGFILANSFGFLTQILLTRLLGPSAYGIYSFAKTGHLLARRLSNLGSNKSLMRYLPEYINNPATQRDILSLSYFLSFIASVLTALIVIVAAPTIAQYSINDPVFIIVLRIFAIILIFDTLMQITSHAFRALELAKYDVLIRRINYQGLILIAAIVSFLLGFQLFETVLAIGVASFATFLGGLWLSSRHLPISPSWSVENIELTSYLSYSIPLSAKDMGQFFYVRTDILMIGIFFSSSDVGIYNVAVLLGSVITLPIAAVGLLFPPIASRLYSQGKIDELSDIYTTVSRWSMTCSLPLALGAIVYREELLLLFGSGFIAGGGILIVLTVGYIVDSLIAQTGNLLMMTDHQYLVFANQWLAAFLNIGLSYVLILEFGVIGAAYATATALIALNILRVVEIWHLENMMPLSWSLIKPIVSIIPSAISMVVISSLHILSPITAMFVGGGLGIGVYGASLAMLGLSDADRSLYNSIK